MSIPKLKDLLSEKITLPIKIGDTVMMGKFKNKKVVVKTIDWNVKGDLLINGRPALKLRIPPKSNLKFEVVDRKFRGTNFIYTLKTPSNTFIPVFVHSHHVHQHEVEEKFGGVTGNIGRLPVAFCGVCIAGIISIMVEKNSKKK